MPRAAASRRPRRPASTAPRARRETSRRIFLAAAHAFSDRGFDGVSVDDIASDAGVNKAMIYYHFGDKLTLYREVVRDMLRDAGTALDAVAADAAPAPARITRFIETFVQLKEARPWMPTLMLREMAAGAPHLDMETFKLMRGVFGSFSRILTDGHRDGRFRDVEPILGYLSVIAPILLNDARERAGRRRGRRSLPFFAPIARDVLLAHVQRAALHMLERG